MCLMWLIITSLRVVLSLCVRCLAKPLSYALQKLTPLLGLIIQKYSLWDVLFFKVALHMQILP